MDRPRPDSVPARGVERALPATVLLVELAAAAASVAPSAATPAAAAVAPSVAAPPAPAVAHNSCPPELRPFARIGVWPPGPPLLQHYAEVLDVGRLATDWQWCTDALVETTPPDHLHVIKGGGLQVPVRPEHRLFAATELHMRRGLAFALGQEQRSMALVAMVQRVTAPGDGAQPLHADFPLDTRAQRELAARSYSAIFFPTPCESTILPRLSAIQHNRTLESANEQRRLLRPSNFFSLRVRAGTLVLFRGDVFHAAPRNRGTTPRVGIYGMFVPMQELARGLRNFNAAWYPFGEGQPFELHRERKRSRA